MLPTTVRGSAESAESREKVQSADEEPGLTEAVTPAIEKESPKKHLGAGALMLSESGYPGRNEGDVETGGCTPSKTCTDMFEACQEKGLPCNRLIDPKKTLCAICLENCTAKNPYKYSECYKCGFE